MCVRLGVPLPLPLTETLASELELVPGPNKLPEQLVKSESIDDTFPTGTQINAPAGNCR